MAVEPAFSSVAIFDEWDRMELGRFFYLRKALQALLACAILRAGADVSPLGSTSPANTTRADAEAGSLVRNSCEPIAIRPTSNAYGIIWLRRRSLIINLMVMIMHADMLHENAYEWEYEGSSEDRYVRFYTCICFLPRF
jgi:hypothetical protein